MSTIILLEDTETGAEKAFYSADARDVLARSAKWKFKRRLGRTATMVQTGVAATKKRDGAGAETGAVEFSGQIQADEQVRQVVEPPEPPPDQPLAPRPEDAPAATPKKGERGGKQT